MSSNLQNSGNGFKELLLKKLSYAVTCSVLSHLTVVLVYIIGVNFSVQPAEWFRLTFNTLTSFSTWLHVIPFTCIIFAQVVICAKDYVFKETCQYSRFEKCMSIFSIRTCILGLLHIIVGGLAVWLYLSLGKGQYQDMYVKCKEVHYCLVEGSFFMILGGVWSGIYFFIRLYIADKSLIFPVIQQRKLLHFKAKLIPLLKESKNATFYPAVCYFALYYVFGYYFRDAFAHLFKLRLENEALSFWLYLYAWIFTFLYIFNMNLMQFFFELFLTEPVEYPVILLHDNDASLSEALLLNNIPIIQHLACLDLYLLSVWSPQRRQALFTLSQPGAHPHTWNRLIEKALKLLTEFTERLDRSAAMLLDREEPLQISKNELLLHKHEQVLQNSMHTPQKFENMRSLSSPYSPTSPNSTINFSSQQTANAPVISEIIMLAATEKLKEVYERIKNMASVKYIFGELPEAHIQHCLKNGQLIVWTAQGLANIVVASFKEDPYGVVQKDLSVLITSLVRLKQSVEKLNKVPTFSRKGPSFDDFGFKMKNNVHSAVKRSLCNICGTFGKYMNDIPLNRDVVAQLQCYL